jgi:hypothetical protein
VVFNFYWEKMTQLWFHEIHGHNFFFFPKSCIFKFLLCAYIVWVISPPCLPPHFPSSPPQFQAGPVLPLWLILLKKRPRHNKKDKAFLLVELRIAIQKDSYYCSHVPMCYVPCWFNSNWFTLVPDPLLLITCHFKVSVLVLLEWGYQTLSCFGFSTYSYISRMCSPLFLWSESKNVAAFALDLKSAYEREHTIFGLLSLANLARNDVLQFHPFTCKW